MSEDRTDPSDELDEESAARADRVRRKRVDRADPEGRVDRVRAVEVPPDDLELPDPAGAGGETDGDADEAEDADGGAPDPDDGAGADDDTDAGAEADDDADAGAEAADAGSEEADDVDGGAASGAGSDDEPGSGDGPSGVTLADVDLPDGLREEVESTGKKLAYGLREEFDVEIDPAVHFWPLVAHLGVGRLKTMWLEEVLETYEVVDGLEPPEES